MPFMRVETASGLWVEIDGPCGREILPCSVVGTLPEYEDTIADCPDGTDPDDYYIQQAFEEFSDYTENSECYSIEELVGWAGRLSADGYTDCTEWIGVYSSQAEARSEVIHTFELCPACEDSVDSPKSGDNPACNFYHY